MPDTTTYVYVVTAFNGTARHIVEVFADIASAQKFMDDRRDMERTLGMRFVVRGCPVRGPDFRKS